MCRELWSSDVGVAPHDNSSEIFHRVPAATDHELYDRRQLAGHSTFIKTQIGDTSTITRSPPKRFPSNDTMVLPSSMVNQQSSSADAVPNVTAELRVFPQGCGFEMPTILEHITDLRVTHLASAASRHQSIGNIRSHNGSQYVAVAGYVRPDDQHRRALRSGSLVSIGFDRETNRWCIWNRQITSRTSMFGINHHSITYGIGKIRHLIVQSGFIFYRNFKRLRGGPALALK